MTLPLSTLYLSIPKPSQKVTSSFQAATNIHHSFFRRFVHASCAITYSSFNAIGYGVTILSYCLTSVIYQDFSHLKENCLTNASYIYKSLQFVAGMTSFLFFACIGRAGHQLDFDRYQLTPESKNPYLQATGTLEVTETTQLTHHPYAFDLYVQQGILLPSNPDLEETLRNSSDRVLILQKDLKTAYVVLRDHRIREWVLQEKLKTCPFFKLSKKTQNLVALTTPPSTPDGKNESSLAKISSSSPSIIPNLEKEEQEGNTSFVLINPSSSAPPAASPSPLSFALEKCWKTVTGNTHIFKDMKYYHILAHYYRRVTQDTDGLCTYSNFYYCPISSSSSSDAQLKELGKHLYVIITQPGIFQNVRQRHQKFILILRQARDLFNPSTPISLKQWIWFLACERFVGIELFGYCKSLIEKYTGAFNNSLSLNNFSPELTRRNKEITNISAQEGLTKMTQTWQRLAGHFNFKDFLLKYNIPYIYAQLQVGERLVTILRHGTPNNYPSLWGGPQITSDYVAFIEGAAQQNKNILHVILENSDPKQMGGDESERVKTRQALVSHKNFYPITLRLDGEFVKSKASTTISKLKEEFQKQFFDLNTGYYVPQKLALTKDNLTKILERVHTTYFKDQTTLDTSAKYDAFIILTYAELILDLCKDLQIDYLEALCKDDIDRGGAMKAVLTLVHLYRTCQINEPEQLENLMVNIMAAPLIVRKDQILTSREKYITSVVDVLKTASSQQHPSSYNGSISYPAPPLQGIVPTGPNCRTIDEYKSFVKKIQEGAIVLTTTCEQQWITSDALSKQLSQMANQSLTISEETAMQHLPIFQAIELVADATTIGWKGLKTLQPLFQNPLLKIVVASEDVKKPQLIIKDHQLSFEFSYTIHAQYQAIPTLKLTVHIADPTQTQATLNITVDSIS